MLLSFKQYILVHDLFLWTSGSDFSFITSFLQAAMTQSIIVWDTVSQASSSAIKGKSVLCGIKCLYCGQTYNHLETQTNGIRSDVKKNVKVWWWLMGPNRASERWPKKQINLRWEAPEVHIWWARILLALRILAIRPQWRTTSSPKWHI